MSESSVRVVKRALILGIALLGAICLLGAIVTILFLRYDPYRAIHAAAEGNLELLRDVVAADPSLIHVPNRWGTMQLPLHVAIRERHLDCAQFLLQHGADPNELASCATPLYWAAANGDTAAIRLLVSAGAKVDTLTCGGRTALAVSARNGHVEAVRLLVQMGAHSIPPMHIACLLSEPDQLTSLLRRSRSGIDRLDINGYSPLHYAALAGSIRCVRILLSVGANARAKNRDGITPLDLAAGEGRLEVVKELWPKYKHVVPRTSDGSTPLHEAAYAGQDPVVNYFLENGMPVGDRTVSGESAIHFASESRRASTVAVLLEHGAGVNSLTADGDTPLHSVSNRSEGGPSEQQAIQVALVLIEHGASLGLRNHQGETPKQKAKSQHLARLAAVM